VTVLHDVKQMDTSGHFSGERNG